MNLLSERILKLSESATIAMSRKSREMKENGIDVISLSLGEPDFNTPDYIKEAAKRAVDNNFSHYPPIPGYKELRQAISNKFKRDNNLDYAPEQIVVSTGAKQCIANVVLCVINPGDEVLLPAPYWVSYYEIVRLAGGVPVVIETSIENDFKVTREQLEAHTTAKTKMLIFSSPCNPSGSVFSEGDLEDIAEYLRDHKSVLAISDEIYELITFQGKHLSLANFEGVYDQIITINGLSKGFAMTGWRCGYIGAPKWLADACIKIQGQFTSATSGITQQAAITALSESPERVADMRAAFLQRRDLVLDLIKDIVGFKCNTPQGAFYVFPNISAFFGAKADGFTIANSYDLCMYFLEKAHVAMVPGEAFGSPECIRISYASSEKDLKEAFSRIKAAAEKLLS